VWTNIRWEMWGSMLITWVSPSKIAVYLISFFTYRVLPKRLFDWQLNLCYLYLFCLIKEVATFVTRNKSWITFTVDDFYVYMTFIDICLCHFFYFRNKPSCFWTDTKGATWRGRVLKFPSSILATIH
jgi:hypothetical protein